MGEEHAGPGVPTEQGTQAIPTQLSQLGSSPEPVQQLL